MKAIHRKRLEKLAEHLEKGNLGHKKFDFSTFNLGPRGQHTGPTVSNRCGFSGCALGECPIAFPDDWKFDLWGDPALAGGHDYQMPIACSRSFFGISETEAKHLFVPEYQNPAILGGKHLGNGATRYQVAANIRAFLKIKAKQAKAVAAT